MENKPAIVLISGGMDSTTCLAIAKTNGYECYGLSFRYGQRHVVELKAAAKVAKQFKVKEHLVVDMDLRRIGGSALTTDDIPVPKNRMSCSLLGPNQMETTIPITYVPARNTIFLSFALAWAEVLNCKDIFIGVNALDYSGYPDCRPAFIKAFEELATHATRLGTQQGKKITIHAPLIKMSKAQIIQTGLSLGIDYKLTFSCYSPSEDGLSCGVCDACFLRQKGFLEAGLEDPLPYGNKS